MSIADSIRINHNPKKPIGEELEVLPSEAEKTDLGILQGSKYIEEGAHSVVDITVGTNSLVDDAAHLPTKEYVAQKVMGAVGILSVDEVKGILRDFGGSEDIQSLPADGRKKVLRELVSRVNARWVKGTPIYPSLKPLKSVVTELNTGDGFDAPFKVEEHFEGRIAEKVELGKHTAKLSDVARQAAWAYGLQPENVDLSGLNKVVAGYAQKPLTGLELKSVVEQFGEPDDDVPSDVEEYLEGQVHTQKDREFKVEGEITCYFDAPGILSSMRDQEPKTDMEQIGENLDKMADGLTKNMCARNRMFELMPFTPLEDADDIPEQKPSSEGFLADSIKVNHGRDYDPQD